MTKIDESIINEENHIILLYRQHSQYICINFTNFTFQATFNIYVKVWYTQFYRI